MRQGEQRWRYLFYRDSSGLLLWRPEHLQWPRRNRAGYCVNTTSAVFTLDFTTNNLTVQINTNYAGAPGNSSLASDVAGTNYGSSLPRAWRNGEHVAV